eukprot:769758-Prorocentrum_minimum.AAC.3
MNLQNPCQCLYSKTLKPWGNRKPWGRVGVHRSAEALPRWAGRSLRSPRFPRSPRSAGWDGQAHLP